MARRFDCRATLKFLNYVHCSNFALSYFKFIILRSEQDNVLDFALHLNFRGSILIINLFLLASVYMSLNLNLNNLP